MSTVGHDAGSADELVVRPQRIRWVSGITAVVVVAVFAVVAVLLRGDGTGVYFRPADQLAMVGIGLLIAGAALLLTRPRLRVVADGLVVRNVLGDRLVPWDLVADVSFPDGASFARVELPDDEYLAVMAIQAADGERAVAAIEAVRDRVRRHLRTADPGTDTPDDRSAP